MKHVASTDGVTLPEGLEITGKVGIGQIPAGFGIEVALDISLPGMDKAEADALVEKAHQGCPYSNATRGNIDVTLNVSV